MSQPNEPRFEDDFDVDTDPIEENHQYQNELTLYDIARNKAWTYTLEYDSNSGMVSPRSNASELKEAYKAGFLEGFAYRLTQPTPDTGE